MVPLRAAMLLMPTTSPAILTSGPPEFPGFTAASVWMKSKPGAATWSGAPLRLDLDQGQIHAVVLTDEPALEAPSVRQLDLDLLGLAHDMRIGDQIAVLPDDEARSGGPPLLGRTRRLDAVGLRLRGAPHAHLNQRGLEPLGEPVHEVIEPRDLGRRRRALTLLPQRLGSPAGRRGESKDHDEGSEGSQQLMGAEMHHPSFLLEGVEKYRATVYLAGQVSCLGITHDRDVSGYGPR